MLCSIWYLHYLRFKFKISFVFFLHTVHPRTSMRNHHAFITMSSCNPSFRFGFYCFLISSFTTYFLFVLIKNEVGQNLSKWWKMREKHKRQGKMSLDKSFWCIRKLLYFISFYKARTCDLFKIINRIIIVAVNNILSFKLR